MVESLLIFLVLSLPLKSEEQIDIWNKSKKTEQQNIIQNKINLDEIKKSNTLNTVTINNDIEIESNLNNLTDNSNIFGIYEVGHTKLLTPNLFLSIKINANNHFGSNHF